jgi:CRP-like cAMP-binding protein
MTHSLFLNLEKDYRMNYYDFIKDAVSKLKLAFDSDMQEYLEEVHFEKNDFLLKAGQVSKHHYFILDGILRFYYLKDGNEVVSNFSFPNDICASYRSYLLQQPSLEFIQAITPGKAYRIKVNDFGALMHKTLKLTTL